MAKRRSAKKKQVQNDPIARAAATGDWGALARSAYAETRRNRGRIEAGETFAAQKRTGREPAPSKSKGTKHS